MRIAQLLEYLVSSTSKLLFVTNDFGPRAGGIETFIIGLIERLPKNQVIVYTSAQKDTSAYDAKWMSEFGVEVIRDRSKILLPTPRVARAVCKIAKNQRIQSVAFGAAAPLALLAPALRRAGVIRIVAMTHGHEVWWAKIFPFNIAMRQIGNSVDVLTYLGEFTRSAISKSLSTRARQSMVKIAPGIDIERFKPVDATDLRKSLALEFKKVIICVARLVHRKGQDALIEAMAQILEHEPAAHLLLVGQGPYRNHLESLVRKYRLEENVTFVGRIQYGELPRYLCVGDIFAMPARSRFNGLEVEGLGIVYLEASACGLPVIAGSSGGAPDAVIESVTGLVVDGTERAEIVVAILELLGDPARCADMGLAGRKWIIEKWRWEIWASEFRKVLQI